MILSCRHLKGELVKTVYFLLTVLLAVSSIAHGDELNLAGVYGQGNLSCIDLQKSREDQAPPKDLPQLTVTLTLSSVSASDETYKMVFQEGQTEDRGVIAIDSQPLALDNPFHASTFGSATNIQWRQLSIGMPDQDTLIIVEEMTPDNFDLLVRGSCPLGQTSVLILKKQK
jgi:hypothetical protein